MPKVNKYTTKIEPEGFQYKPACGTVNQDGSVTVSGVNMNQEDIDSYGTSYKALDDVFREVELGMKKEDSKKE